MALLFSAYMLKIVQPLASIWKVMRGKTAIKPTFFNNRKASDLKRGAQVLFSLVLLAGKVIYLGSKIFKNIFYWKTLQTC